MFKYYILQFTKPKNKQFIIAKFKFFQNFNCTNNAIKYKKCNFAEYFN